MEERLGWSGAFRTAWDNLTGVNDEGNIKFVRWFFYLVFIAGAALAGWFYFRNENFLIFDEAVPQVPANTAEQDKKTLDDMINRVAVTSQRRIGSPATVEILAANPRNPFGEPTVYVPPVTDEGQVTVELPPEVVIDYPPEGITLRGIMIVGNDRVAVMDIPNVGSGMIVKAGYTFMQRKGRIVRIAPDKVVVNWGGKNWDIAPSF